MARIWDDLIDEATQQRYKLAGYGRIAGFGQHPALVMVDLFVTDGTVTGSKSSEFSDPLPPDIDTNIQAIRTLVAAARMYRLPIFYTNDRFEPDGGGLGAWRHKNWAAPSLAKRLAGKSCPWIDAVAPGPDDWVIYKQRPSAFFGTPLVANLVDLGIDTVVVGGQATSGCVRATVVDAFSYGFERSW
jgi:nicotinamidase-related amidase